MTPPAILGLVPALFLTAGPLCPVRLVPADAPRPWAAAASALENTLRVTPTGDRDCLEVVVRAAPSPTDAGASVEIITTDGRHGVRRLADARDLEPTVAALIVTISPGLPAAAAPADGDAAIAVAAPAPPSIPWGALVLAGAGARLVLPSAPAPAVELAAGGVRGSWELALVASWVPTFLGAGATAKAGYSSSAELGISVAQRRAVGARGTTDLLFGARASAAGMWNRTLGDDSVMEGAASGSFGDNPVTAFAVAPAFAAFLGASLPVFSFVRLRPQLSLQWTPLALSSVPATQSIWSVGFGIAAERRIP